MGRGEQRERDRDQSHNRRKMRSRKNRITAGGPHLGASERGLVSGGSLEVRIDLDVEISSLMRQTPTHTTHTTHPHTPPPPPPHTHTHTSLSLSLWQIDLAVLVKDRTILNTTPRSMMPKRSRTKKGKRVSASRFCSRRSWNSWLTCGRKRGKDQIAIATNPPPDHYK